MCVAIHFETDMDTDFLLFHVVVEQWQKNVRGDPDSNILVKRFSTP